MVDLAIELVAHPVAHSWLPQEAPRPLDQIVEVRHARGPLGLRVRVSERLPRLQPRGYFRREPRAVLNAQEIADQIGEAPGVRLVVRLGLGLAGRDLERPSFGEDDLSQA